MFGLEAKVVVDTIAAPWVWASPFERRAAAPRPVTVLAYAAILLLILPLIVARAAPSEQACAQYAQDAAQGKVAGRVLGGAVVGVMAGSAVGGLLGNAKVGAVVGTGLGAIAGGSGRSDRYRGAYVDAFVDCMRGDVPEVQ
jgi:hypothetical protein